MHRLIWVLMGYACLTTPAWADGAFPHLVTAADQDTLNRIETIRHEAMADAKEHGESEAYAQASALLARTPLPLSGFNMTGDWRCRITKLGGPVGVVRYGWFACRVIDDGGGWQLTKLTGSQRTQGRFYTASDTTNHYLGTVFVAGELPSKYADGNPNNSVGIATRTAENRWQLQLPEPPYESKLDVMEFERR